MKGGAINPMTKAWCKGCMTHNCKKTEFIGFTKILLFPFPFPLSSHLPSRSYPLLALWRLRNWKLNALYGAFCIIHCAPTRHCEICCADNQLSDQEMTSSRSVNSTACNVEIFCHMLFEEFLTTNNMQSTLQAFRKEWERPAEVPLGIDYCRSSALLWKNVNFTLTGYHNVLMVQFDFEIANIRPASPKREWANRYCPRKHC